MEEKDSLKEISNKLIEEMDSWNASNPDASFLEIEVKARELVSKLEARLIQDSAGSREKENWSEREEKERPTCPNCHVPLLSRGKRVRRLQVTTGREIQLKRTYATCPQCGTGFFPPR
jgi:RNase P subunit RPR2